MLYSRIMRMFTNQFFGLVKTGWIGWLPFLLSSIHTLFQGSIISNGNIWKAKKFDIVMINWSKQSQESQHTLVEFPRKQISTRQVLFEDQPFDSTRLQRKYGQFHRLQWGGCDVCQKCDTHHLCKLAWPHNEILCAFGIYNSLNGYYKHNKHRRINTTSLESSMHPQRYYLAFGIYNSLNV